ncbi:hypothetical protein B2J88_49985 [Rhodococcus sp. SRB_17]|uniref:ABC-type transport auxiliary lipoprotein family protein n=1 Tax=Acidovorax sp. SRB_24 TaxID=1962700 RepID=UPI00145EC9BC|nr:ABC-type transport auxiliary lipoprotein family protein [Acidovorax sp. SRB_24]NMM77892.1 hypothetical protein [Acidovorax sp. SRB_24]NMM92284.1 hypothetical protein [Rhodococcus sp. SRB_17]
MSTSNFIASPARLAGAALGFALISLAGCSALPTPPARPMLYDFGPGAAAPAAAPAGQRAPLPALALAEVEGVGANEGNTAVVYRLAYADARQLRPYQLARWSQPPAQLVQQALRSELGQRRAVLRAGDALAIVPGADGRLPDVLRVEIEEFSQVFTSPGASAAVVRLRATLTGSSVLGESLLGQRLFTVQHPATSADAAGGTRALAEAAAQAAQDIAQWLEQGGH